VRLRRKRWNEKPVTDWLERDAAAAFVLAYVGTADNHPGGYMAPDEVCRAALVFRFCRHPGSWRPGEENFVWHYEESLGAIHAVNKVRCRSELALDSALAFGRKWSKENLAKTDRFAAVPEWSRVPSGTRALCVYSLPVVPATIGPHYTELWDWDRDDLIVPRSAKE
jgi:hypothetical protein